MSNYKLKDSKSSIFFNNKILNNKSTDAEMLDFISSAKNLYFKSKREEYFDVLPYLDSEIAEEVNKETNKKKLKSK